MCHPLQFLTSLQRYLTLPPRPPPTVSVTLAGYQDAEASDRGSLLSRRGWLSRQRSGGRIRRSLGREIQSWAKDGEKIMRTRHFTHTHTHIHTHIYIQINTLSAPSLPSLFTHSSLLSSSSSSSLTLSLPTFPLLGTRWYHPSPREGVPLRGISRISAEGFQPLATGT